MANEKEASDRIEYLEGIEKIVRIFKKMLSQFNEFKKLEF